MIFEKINFNEAYWKTKTEAEFIAHERHHGLGEKKLKEAFALMNPKPVEKAVQKSPAISKAKKIATAPKDLPMEN